LGGFHAGGLMAWRLRLAGHPLHPLLVHFPIALWTIAAFAEIGGWARGGDTWWAVSSGAQALGVLVAVAAMATGASDFASLARAHPAADTAVWHMLAMGTAWLLFVASVALRGWPASGPPPVAASVAAFAGFASMVGGGWLGGQLVYRFGVGVRDP
jgi:uncharacterized membrane protein